MAYDRYDTRGEGRRERWRTGDRFDRDRDYGRGYARETDWDREREERGFFDRAGDEIASWFGDEEAERRRRRDEMMRDRDREFGRDRGWFGRDDDRDFGRQRERGWFGSSRDGSDRDDRYGIDRPFGERPGPLSSDGYRGTGPGSDRATAQYRSSVSQPQPGYRPMAGDYGRFDPEYRDIGDRYGDVPRERFRGDREYAATRRRHVEELDRDYDEYCRERQSRFEEDFGSWRERRQQKRGLLGQVREQMEVVGNDDEHVGTVDRVAGDRIILTKSDPESGGSHHSLSCSDIDRVENDKVILELSAEKARKRWRDESRNRALFEREDQGEAGPHMLDRSFSGTYRDR